MNKTKVRCASDNHSFLPVVVATETKQTLNKNYGITNTVHIQRYKLICTKCGQCQQPE